MSQISPYLPIGSFNLPASRFIMFADASNKVNLFDESLKTEAGASFTGYWRSSTLNRKRPGIVHTLSLLVLYGSAEAATTLTVAVSGDGGKTWPEEKIANVVANGDESFASVSGFYTSGPDLRFEVRFDTDTLFRFDRWRARMVERGAAEYVGV